MLKTIQQILKNKENLKIILLLNVNNKLVDLNRFNSILNSLYYVKLYRFKLSDLHYILESIDLLSRLNISIDTLFKSKGINYEEKINKNKSYTIEDIDLLMSYINEEYLLYYNPVNEHMLQYFKYNIDKNHGTY